MLTRRMPKAVMLALVCCQCHNGCADERESKPPAGSEALTATNPGPRGKAKKLALLVGIDKYKAVNGLSGCVADVRNMEGLLRGCFEFPEDSIRVLTNEQATHTGIIQAFKDHLIGRAETDAVIVFHYSGHGSQMNDPSDKAPSAQISTIVPHDSRTEGVFDISADELRGLFSRLSPITKNVTFVFDSCHSGLIMRDILENSAARPRARFVDPDPRVPPPPPPEAGLAPRGVGEAGAALKGRDFALLSACQADEVDFEYADEKGNPCGSLTHFFVAEVLNSGKAGATYRDVMDKVKAKITGVFRRQHPQLEGAKIDDYLLSDKSSLAQPFVLASPEGDGVAFEAGQVHGMTEGSVFDIYAPGTKEFDDPAKAVARAELTSVDIYRSKANLIGSHPIVQSSRAVERQHNFRDRKVRLHIVKPDQSTVLQKVREGVASGGRTDPDNLKSPSFNKTFELVEKPDNAQLLLTEQKTEKGTRSIVLTGGDGTAFSPPVPVDEVKAVDHVLRQLSGWAKWLNVLALENPRGGLNVSFEIRPAAAGGRGPALRGRPDLTLVAGQDVEFTVTNRSGKGVYFAILDLASDGSVGVVYPGEGRSEVLADGKAYTGMAPTSVSEGQKVSRDNLKLVVTQLPVDFRFLRQEAIRVPRDLGDPLADLLGQAALLEERKVGEERKRLDGWATKMKILEVVAQP
jgi:Caspase domain